MPFINNTIALVEALKKQILSCLDNEFFREKLRLIKYFNN